MTFYAFVLFVHIVAVLALFTALSFEVLSLFRLRRASALTQVHFWIEPVPGLPLVALGSLLVVFLSGVYLAVRMSAFSLAWLKVTLAALLLVAPLGVLTGRRVRAIRRDCADAQGINSELLSRLQDPFLKISLGVRIAVYVGIILLMVAKPGWLESISVVGTCVCLGLLSARLILRRSGSLSAPGADLGARHTMS